MSRGHLLQPTLKLLEASPRFTLLLIAQRLLVTPSDEPLGGLPVRPTDKPSGRSHRTWIYTCGVMHYIQDRNQLGCDSHQIYTVGVRIHRQNSPSFLKTLIFTTDWNNSFSWKEWIKINKNMRVLTLVTGSSNNSKHLYNMGAVLVKLIYLSCGSKCGEFGPDMKHKNTAQEQAFWPILFVL